MYSSDDMVRVDDEIVRIVDTGVYEHDSLDFVLATMEFCRIYESEMNDIQHYFFERLKNGDQSEALRIEIHCELQKWNGSDPETRKIDWQTRLFLYCINDTGMEWFSVVEYTGGLQRVGISEVHIDRVFGKYIKGYNRQISDDDTV